MANSRLEELAGIIQKNTAEYNKFIKSINMPEPSFGEDAPLGYPLNQAAVENRNNLLEALNELKALVEGPFMTVFDYSSSNDWLPDHLIYRYKIAEMFPPGGEATYDEIAKKCGLSEPLIRRLLRHAMTRNIFREIRPGVVGHTAASKLVAENESVKAYIGMSREEFWPAGPAMLKAWEKWGESQEPDETAFNLASGAKLSAYLDMTADPERGPRFARSMELVQNAPGFSASHVANNYPWESLGKTKIVDIGGSHGSIVSAIARKNPSIHCIVQDLPGVVEAAPPDVIAEFPGRFEFMAHDMFTEQPVKDADIYMFRFIFHNWSDKYCRHMLQALIPGLKKGARLHIWDQVLPVPGEVGHYETHMKRGMDLIMLTFFNGQEREAGDWTKLIEGTDSRFKVVGINSFAMSELSLIEAEWQG